MSEEQALLDAIIANLDDDGPRLVYADWLIQKGDPRGELIALQCGGAAQRKLKVSENKLLKQHEKEWSASILAALPPMRNILDKPKIVFRRGFVDELATWQEGITRLDAIFDAAPCLSRLRIEGGYGADLKAFMPALRTALENPKLRRLRALDIRMIGAGETCALAVAACPHLAGLEELGLRVSMLAQMRGRDSVQLGVGAISTLARSPHLARVKRLDLSDNPLGGDAIAVVLDGTWPLEELDLSHDRQPKGLADAFAASKRAPTIRRLVLEDTKLTDQDLGKLVSGPALAKLEQLELELAHIGPNKVKGLLDKLPPSVTVLGLARNALCDEGATIVAEHPRIATLKTLYFGHNRLGKVGGEALAASPHLAKIEKVYLGEPRWKPETVELFRGRSTKVFMKGKLISGEETPPPGRAKATKGRSAGKDAPATPSRPSTSPKRGTRR